jgi:hypothetical protein
MECEALRYVRDEMGLTHVKIMIPFVRTVAEIEGVVRLLGEHGLRRGENGLSVVMMCELPSNALLAGDFLEHVDGFSIGSNDMTQLVLGLDRDSSLVAAGFDERDPAVLAVLEMAIRARPSRRKCAAVRAVPQCSRRTRGGVGVVHPGRGDLEQLLAVPGGVGQVDVEDLGAAKRVVCTARVSVRRGPRSRATGPGSPARQIRPRRSAGLPRGSVRRRCGPHRRPGGRPGR